MVINSVTIRGSVSWAEFIWTTKKIVRTTVASRTWTSSPSFIGQWASLYLSCRTRGPNHMSNPPGLIVRMDIWHPNLTTVSCGRTFQVAQSSPVELFRNFAVVKFGPFLVGNRFITRIARKTDILQQSVIESNWVYFLDRGGVVTKIFMVGMAQAIAKQICRWGEKLYADDTDALIHSPISKRRSLTVLLQSILYNAVRSGRLHWCHFFLEPNKSGRHLSELTDRSM